MFALARSTVVGMSCSLQSTKTGACAAMRRTASGPRAQKSSSPTLSMPDLRRERRRRAAPPRRASETSSATISGFSGRGITAAPSGSARRLQPGCAQPAAEIGRRGDALRLAGSRTIAARDLDGGRRVDERRGPHLHGPRAGEQHLDRVLPDRDAAARDRPARRAPPRPPRHRARASAASARGPTASPCTVPERRARSRRGVHGRCAGGDAHEREPRRPGADRCGASSDDVAVPPGSFANTGTSDMPRDRADDLAQSVGVRPEHRSRSSSSSGPERWISIAATSGRALQRAGEPDVLLQRPSRRSTRSPAPARARDAGSSSATNASIPGFCSPVVHTMPDARLGDPRRRRPLRAGPR